MMTNRASQEWREVIEPKQCKGWFGCSNPVRCATYNCCLNDDMTRVATCVHHFEQGIGCGIACTPTRFCPMRQRARGERFIFRLAIELMGVDDV